MRLGGAELTAAVNELDGTYRDMHSLRSGVRGGELSLHGERERVANFTSCCVASRMDRSVASATYASSPARRVATANAGEPVPSSAPISRYSQGVKSP